MKRLRENSIDSVVTDPPYELGFMGKSWDSSGIAFRPETWAAVLRVLKPGGYLLAFGGSRTFHRIAVAIEDAGFEIRDTLSWMYGTGFPKSLDVSKAIDQQERGTMVRAKLLHFARMRGINGQWLEERGVASASSFKDWTVGGHVPGEKNWQIIKAALEVTAEEEAAFERAVVARGTAGLGASASGGAAFEGGYRTEFNITAPATDAARQWEGWGTALKPAWEPVIMARKPLAGTVAANVQRWGSGALNIDGCRIAARADDYNHPGNAGIVDNCRIYGTFANKNQAKPHDLGRWPANVVLDEEAAAALDAQTGTLKSGAIKAHHVRTTSKTKNTFGERAANPEPPRESSEGGASRFFYVAKASRSERDAGCEALPARSAGEATDRGDDTDGLSSPRAGAGRTGGARNIHPTVKPVELMRWLVRLVTPPGGYVFDPFAGSGTTGVAALQEGFVFGGCEREPEYATIAIRRLTHAQRKP